MSQEFKNGALWGAGFGLSCSLILGLWIFFFELLANPQKPEWKFSTQKNMSVKAYTQRIVQKSELKHFLVISGEIQGDPNDAQPDSENSIFIEVIIRDENGTFLDRCTDEITYESYVNNNVSWFQAKCLAPNDMSQSRNIAIAIEHAWREM